MNRFKTICITGGTGLVGKDLEETAPENFQIVSIHKRDYTVDDPKATHMVLDVRDKDQVDELFVKYEFDAVVHAAGISSVDFVETHYAESLESNLDGTRNLALACREAGCYLVYVSTNAVFDGSSAPYRESDPVRSVNKYGQIKIECEKLVSQLLKRFSIVRPILMYGWNHPVGRMNPVTWLLDRLMRGEVVHMVNDVYENPLYNLQCGQAIWEMIRKKPSGAIHVAGSEVLNRYEFALKVAKVFGLDVSLIRPVESSFFPSIAPRPKNTSFVTERVEQELELEPWDVERGLHSMKSRMRVRI